MKERKKNQGFYGKHREIQELINPVEAKLTEQKQLDQYQ